ncbi:MAG: hypothetical protein AB1393_04560 [Candidatus Edwardsbacteria bacterium]
MKIMRCIPLGLILLLSVLGIFGHLAGQDEESLPWLLIYIDTEEQNRVVKELGISFKTPPPVIDGKVAEPHGVQPEPKPPFVECGRVPEEKIKVLKDKGIKYLRRVNVMLFAQQEDEIVKKLGIVVPEHKGRYPFIFSPMLTEAQLEGLRQKGIVHYQGKQPEEYKDPGFWQERMSRYEKKEIMTREDTLRIYERLKEMSKIIDSPTRRKEVGFEEYKRLVQEWNTLVEKIRPKEHPKVRDPLLAGRGIVIDPDTNELRQRKDSAQKWQGPEPDVIMELRDDGTIWRKRKGESEFHPAPTEQEVEEQLKKRWADKEFKAKSFYKVEIKVATKDHVKVLRKNGIDVPDQVPAKIIRTVNKLQLEEIEKARISYRIIPEESKSLPPPDEAPLVRFSTAVDTPVVIWSEGFESGHGIFDKRYDTNPDSGYDYWERSTKRPWMGSYSVWCAQNGDKTGTYDDAMEALIYNSSGVNVAVSGSYAYVADRNAGMRIIYVGGLPKK